MPFMHRAFYLLAIAVFTLFWVDTMWGAPIDLAHHYALVFRIADEWQLPVPNDPSLGEMAFYPSAAHQVAAVLGVLIGSPLLGLQLVTLVSVATLWLALVWLLSTLPPRAAVVSVVLFAIGVALNRFYFGLYLHGVEVVENFLFAQLVGQTVTLIALTVAVRTERDGGWWLPRISLFVVAVLLPWVHLLGALELFGAFVVVLISDIPTGEMSRRRWASLLLVPAGAAAIYFNPAFRVMTGISGNNGVLRAGVFVSVQAHLGLAVAVLAMSAMLLAVWRARRFQNPVLRYLAAYGASVGGLCLLQFFALQLGFGSEYAVKKYSFALVTFLFVAGAALLGIAAEQWLRPGRWERIRPAATFAAFVSVLLCLGGSRALDISDTVALEHKVINLRNSVLTPGESAVALNLGAVPTAVPYMLSIGVLKTPRSKMNDVLVKDELGDPTRFDQVIVGSASPILKTISCPATFSGGGLVVIEARCIKTGAPQP